MCARSLAHLSMHSVSHLRTTECQIVCTGIGCNLDIHSHIHNNQETPSTWPNMMKLLHSKSVTGVVAFVVAAAVGVLMSLPMFLCRYFFGQCLCSLEICSKKSFFPYIQLNRPVNTSLCLLCEYSLISQQPSFLGHATKIKNLFELFRKYEVNIYVSCNHWALALAQALERPTETQIQHQRRCGSLH